MTIFTGIDSGDEYKVKVSEIKTNHHKELCVDVIIEIDGDVETISFSEVRKNNASKWIIDNLGIKNGELEKYLIELF